MATTHSPYFVSGKVFEDVRIVRRHDDAGSSVKWAKAHDVAEKIGHCLNKPYDPPSAAVARIQQALQPQISEMFFGTRIVFVEGREDVALLQTYLELKGFWSKFRSLGCHIVPADGKSELLRPLVIAQALAIPAFLVFDCDGDSDEKWRHMHERDNRALFRAMAMPDEEAFPETLFVEDCIAWKNNITSQMRSEIPDDVWQNCQNATDVDFDHGGGLKKNVMHVAAFVEKVWDAGVRPPSLERAAESLLRFATP